MSNVNTKIDGNVLHITIAVDKATLDAAQPSKSGKTKVVATTSGFLNLGLPGGKVLGLSLNATTK